MQLFNLQIVNGSEYRNDSNKKLTRDAKIEAARGSIMDRSGNVLVSTEMHFSLEMYKSKTEDEQLNNSILLMTNILEANGNEYIDNFPISIEPFEFHFETEDELIDWKTKYKIPEAASAEEAFYLFRDKYKINIDNPKEIRQILAIRYAISTIGYSTTRSIEISKEISRESAVQLQENSQNLTGVNIVIEPIRVYHTGNLAAHIIGYMGRYSDDDKKEFEKEGDTHKYDVDDKVGRYGIEKIFENYLRGEDGKKQIDMSVDGIVMGEYTSQEAIGGSDVVLTIDANLQGITERALENNIMKIREGGFSEQHPAEGGAAVVVNVNSGEILAMASYPNFQPELFYNGISQAQMNEYLAEDAYNPLYSRATQGAYPPGSIFKMVTAVAGIEEGKISTTEKVNDNGRFIVSDDPNYQRNPACWYFNSYGRGHGWLDVKGAIKASCNYYFYEVGKRVGIDTLDYWAGYFGLGNKTGIELSESTGILAKRELITDRNWSLADTASASIGQSLNTFTPVQMAKYIAMISNGGHPIDLSIVKNVVNSNGTQVSQDEVDKYVSKKLNREIAVTEDKNISEETMNAIHEGMKSVAEDAGGTAYTILKDFEIEMGGKTGSAELTDDKESKEVIAWFAGYAPYDNPEIAIVVMVEKGGHGSYAAEVVRDIMTEYFGMNMDEIREPMSAVSEMESFR
jgi:penicillin-binding protein 2